MKILSLLTILVAAMSKNVEKNNHLRGVHIPDIQQISPENKQIYIEKLDHQIDTLYTNIESSFKKIQTYKDYKELIETHVRNNNQL